VHNKVASRSWQNTEEEEFDWEDMSPTLSERGRSNDFLPSSIPPFGSVVPRPAFGRLSAIHAESDIRSNRSSLAPMAFVDGSSNIAEEAVSILGVRCLNLFPYVLLFKFIYLFIYCPKARLLFDSIYVF
jgi:pre-mRNA cleavage complex 2 protein Pcf11